MTIPLDAIPVGARVDRRRWPLHITLVGNFTTSADLDDLVSVLREVAARTPSFEMQVLEEAWFAPDRPVLVDLVERPVLAALHGRLLDAIRRVAEVEPLVPEHLGPGYRPHATVTADARVRGRVSVASIAPGPSGPAGRGEAAALGAAFDRGPATPAPPVTADAVVALLDDLVRAGVRVWVVGGWGVDALLGEQTRAHHDVDLLVHVEDLARLLALLSDRGGAVRHLWSESRWIEQEDGGLYPSAFVVDGTDGEVDLHVVDIRGERPVSLSASDVLLPAGALAGVGVIGGRAVRCATAEAQLLMHDGYELPPPQRADVERLHSLP